MEEVKVPFHKHLVRPFTRFAFSWCGAPCASYGARCYIYGGYRCNEPGCETGVLHKECAEGIPEITHFSHPEHPLTLIRQPRDQITSCFLCRKEHRLNIVYRCSAFGCPFEIDMECVRRTGPESSYLHEHPLELLHGEPSDSLKYNCAACGSTTGDIYQYYYRCQQCRYAIHLICVDDAPEAYHTSHPDHPLKPIMLRSIVPDYADKNCLLCGDKFDYYDEFFRHCDVCNFSICRKCMRNPPPVCVVSSRTHEHQFHLVPRRMEFTCNLCGTLGDRSPYFCLECNFMIHRECIDLPRVININRHDHRIAYTRRLGYGEWKCGVCRKKVDGFYGAYTCSKCPSFSAHARCATRGDVWDMVELEGMPEEEETAPFEVVDDITIKHFSHKHNLQINKDGKNLHESLLCAACALQICSESFYSCTQCNFILHEKCASLPRKKRHLCYNQSLTLDRCCGSEVCFLCKNEFSGFRYASKDMYTRILDVRCGSISEPFVHESHPHPLYYVQKKGYLEGGKLSCDECEDFSLEFKDAILPQKVMLNRYDDHPLCLSYGESNVDRQYWCEACETKLNPKEWNYTCNDCGIALHVSCVVGDFLYVKPGSYLDDEPPRMRKSVSNASICRPFCAVCESRCLLRTIIKVSKSSGGFVYACSSKCCREIRSYE